MNDEHAWTGGYARYALWPMLALLGALVLGVSASAAAGAQSGVEVETDTREYVVGPPSNSPEGVVYDEETEAFYGGATFDGTLYKATLDDPTAELYLPPGVDGRGRPDGRTEAVGMNVDDEGRLYVSGGSSGNVYVYDIETRALVATLSTGPGGFINDVTISENGDVYFTDSATSNPARHVIWRATEEQVEEGGGTPEAIPLAPEVPWQPGFNANGIRAVNDEDEDDDEEDGKFVIFDDLNSAAVYRLRATDDPAGRRIRQIRIQGGPEFDADGLELDGRTLYVVRNGGSTGQELIDEVRLSEDYLRGRVVSRTTSPDFHTPTTASLAPGGRLLVSNAEFYDQSEAGPPYYVVSIPRP